MPRYLFLTVALVMLGRVAVVNIATPAAAASSVISRYCSKAHENVLKRRRADINQSPAQEMVSAAEVVEISTENDSEGFYRSIRYPALQFERIVASTGSETPVFRPDAGRYLRPPSDRLHLSISILRI